MRDEAMIDELLVRANDAIRVAKEAGASDVFVGANRSRGVEMEMRDGTLEKVQESTSRSLSIDLWVDGRYGSHSTTDLRPDRLAAFLADAVALTRALQPDEHRRITDPALFEGRSDADLELVDPAVIDMSREDRMALLEAMSGAVAGADRLISASTSVSTNHGITAAVSSNGFEGVREGTSCWFGTDVTLQDDGDKRPEGSMYAGGRYRADLPDPTDIAAQALTRAGECIGMTKGPTAKTTLLVRPNAGSMLLWRLMQPANGGSVQQGSSFWAGKVGQELISDVLEVHDEPLLKRGLASRPFDGEGIASRSMPILKDGALQNLYLDTYYASKLGLAPTTGGASNRVITPGERDLDALVAATTDGFLVTSWLGGNMDGTTGDFSFGIRGFRVEKGQLGQAVGEMNVTGNIVDLFAKLVEVGSDPWPYGSMRSPTLVFDGVQFSGA